MKLIIITRWTTKTEEKRQQQLSQEEKPLSQVQQSHEQVKQSVKQKQTSQSQEHYPEQLTQLVDNKQSFYEQNDQSQRGFFQSLKE